MLLRHADDEFVLTAAEPNLAYFEDLIGAAPGRRSRTVSDDWAVLASRARGRAGCSAAGAGGRDAAVLRPHQGEDRARCGSSSRAPGTPATWATRSGSRRRDALTVWDAVWDASRGPGRAAVRPPGAVHDPHRGRPAPARRRLPLEPLRLDGRRPRRRPIELGLGWMLRGLRRGRARVHRPRRDPPRAGAQDVPLERPGSSSTGRTGTGIHDEAGLIPPKDHTPVQEEFYVYDDARRRRSATRRASCTRRCSSGTSRSPASRSTGRRRARRVKLEMPVSHRYDTSTPRSQHGCPSTTPSEGRPER